MKIKSKGFVWDSFEPIPSGKLTVGPCQIGVGRLVSI
jgi:hypothetical protein